MGLPETIALALGVAMDAFAIALVVGASPYNVGFSPTFRISFHFGFFQFLMPLLGWALGWKWLSSCISLSTELFSCCYSG